MIDRMHAALLVIDVQHDFLPGGALPVREGDRILAPLRRLLEARVFDVVVATQDWHPPNHVSFASHHADRRPFETITLYGHDQVLWPDHCVAGTPGAELDPDLPWRYFRAIVRKGTDPAVDSYSGFRNNWNVEGRRPPTGLAGYLREIDVTEVFVCGLARDVCVKWTAEDAASLGFKTTVLWDLTRPVDPASDSAVAAALGAAGVRIAESAAVA
jgi:nicotinamidase/pyrazinamidase